MSITLELQQECVISPFKELVAYELLWSEMGSSFKKMANLLIEPQKLPSQILLDNQMSLFSLNTETKSKIESLLKKKSGQFSIMLKENCQYPKKLLDAKNPIDLFYYKGNLDITKERLISVVGTRNLSDDGEKRTKKLVSLLAKNGFGIVSGLAKGTDTVALTTAIEKNVNVIGVIGTPIDEYYPKENKELQDFIADKYLLISQVPFYKYSVEPFKTKRIYFTERNATMAALSLATIIVEASDTSGTLVQARACIEQNRPLFILNSCFENTSIKWPQKFEKLGAIRVRNIEDIIEHLMKKNTLRF